MSIRQPKPRQIRLPFNVPKPKKGADVPVRVCGICRSKDSRYTCPRCNVPYCSLACFRDPAHAQCSEPFYKDTVMGEIASDPHAQAEEKRAMMDMLRRFEESAAEGEDVMAALEAEEDDDDALAAALEGVDLDQIDSNELLRLLPQKHRDAFLATIKDPESAAAKELVAAAVEGGEGERHEPPAPTALPWWEAGLDEGDDGPACAPEPPAIDADAQVAPPPDVGGKLVYNIAALCMAYVHTLLSLRLPSLAPEYLEAQDVTPAEVRGELQALLPFLADKSTVRYENVRDAWAAVWEAMEGEGGVDTLAFLLDKVADLLHPPITMDPPKAERMLADMWRVCSTPKKTGALPRKLAFYAAAMSQLGRKEWLGVEGDVRREAERLRAEMPEEEEPEGAKESVLLSSKS